jgi:hypothetical protein
MCKSLGCDRLFTLNDLEEHYGETMQINGIVFTLTKVQELSGTLAVWQSDDNEFVIISTPFFDNVPVPVQLLQHGYEPLEDDWVSLGTDSYPAEVFCFYRYCTIVKTLVEKIFRRG